MYFYSQYFRNSYFRSQYFVTKYFFTYVCSGQLVLDGTYIKILDGTNVLIKSNNCLNTDLIYDVYNDYYKNLNKLNNIKKTIYSANIGQLLTFGYGDFGSINSTIMLGLSAETSYATDFDQTHETEILTDCKSENTLAKKKEYYDNTLDKLNKLRKIVYINK